MRNLLQLDLKFDRQVVAITILTTLTIMADRYHEFSGVEALDRVFLYLLLPLLVIMLVFRQKPQDFGFRIGDWKAGLAISALVMLLAVPVILLSATNPAMRDYYSWQLNPLTPLMTFIDLFGWEFFFRGLLLFGYARVFGEHALWLQAVPFALAHLGKPELETLSTIFGGFLFGVVAWRTRSFFYAFLIHWFINTLVIYAAGGAFGG